MEFYDSPINPVQSHCRVPDIPIPESWECWRRPRHVPSVPLQSASLPILESQECWGHPRHVPSVPIQLSFPSQSPRNAGDIQDMSLGTSRTCPECPTAEYLNSHCPESRECWGYPGHVPSVPLQSASVLPIPESREWWGHPGHVLSVPLQSA